MVWYGTDIALDSRYVKLEQPFSHTIRDFDERGTARLPHLP